MLDQAEVRMGRSRLVIPAPVRKAPGLSTGLPVLTTDRAWRDVRVGVAIRVVR